MSCDCETPEFYSLLVCRARKPYRCCECRGAIEKGQKYERIAGKWEGGFMTECTCLPCADLRDLAQLYSYEAATRREQIWKDWRKDVSRSAEFQREINDLPELCDCIPFGQLQEHLVEAGFLGRDDARTWPTQEERI